MSSDKLAVITGGTGGIGLAVARRLAERGLRLVLVGRDPERGARALSTLGSECQADFLAADLSSARAVRDLAERLRTGHKRIDILINNFGGQYADRWVTEDGHEATFATNVLNPFLLSFELLDPLRAAAPSRIVFVSSSAHEFARLELDDLESERFYRGLDIYARAKLLQVLASKELAGRLRGDGVSVVSVNPGAAWTEQTAKMKPRMVAPAMRLYWPIMRMVQRRAKPEKAARPIVFAATEPSLDGLSDLWIDDRSRVAEPGRRARDGADARRVYERVVALLGDSPGPPPATGPEG
ncbi:SDR family NAD(P)-dependent oxidoreductase [Nonomuraea sp. NPDC050404]|uniref:SDR family NAD(P)-dependent oxidoreductase n=1 Tax=Nonomuraea sp. NPDC050404 TaxID=3155783 RepID=UPI0033F0E3BD